MMTRINLLPGNKRKGQLSSLASVLPVLLVAGVVLACAAGFGWVHYVMLAGVETAHGDLARQKALLQPDVNYHRALSGELGEYQAREQTIEAIHALRVPWTRKLDELWDVTVQDPAGEDRYLVYFANVTVKAPRFTARARGPQEGETITLKGLCFSDRNALQSFTFYHEALTSSPFYVGDFVSITNPEGSLVTTDDEKTPARGWTVDLELKMKPREKGKKSRVRNAAGR